MNAGPRIGTLPSGARDAISDVTDVTVGHATISDGNVETGVTVVVPHNGNVYLEKVPAASCVLNGFGKTVGLIQVDELGVLETPIALTNTFSVGTVATALIRRTAKRMQSDGATLVTLNPVVAECNDRYLNDIHAFAVSDQHVEEAFARAAAEFDRGSVGAGRGMSCFGLKGGIGTASRVVRVADNDYTIGALVLANFGRLPQLIVAGRRVGPLLETRVAAKQTMEQGSVIVVLATDAPVDARQLRRIAFRASAGIGRTGGVFGHGSGDIAIAFSTSSRVAEGVTPAIAMRPTLAEPLLDPLFDATAESTEQAIVDALFSATTVVGHDGHVRHAFVDVAPDWEALIRDPDAFT